MLIHRSTVAACWCTLLAACIARLANAVTFTLVANTDYVGFNIGMLASTPQPACEAACLKSAQCIMYEVVNSGTIINACFLKSAVSTTTTPSKGVMAYIPAASPPSPQSSTSAFVRYQNMDYIGNNLPPLVKTNQSACQAACLARGKGCAMYEVGTAGGLFNMCFLKSAVPATSRATPGIDSYLPAGQSPSPSSKPSPPPPIPPPPPPRLSPSPPPPPTSQSDTLSWGPVVGTVGLKATELTCPTGALVCGIDVMKGSEWFDVCCVPTGISIRCTDGTVRSAMNSPGSGWTNATTCSGPKSALSGMSAYMYNDIVIGIAGVGDGNSNFGDFAGRQCPGGMYVAGVHVSFRSALDRLVSLSVACGFRAGDPRPPSPPPLPPSPPPRPPPVCLQTSSSAEAVFQCTNAMRVHPELFASSIQAQCDYNSIKAGMVTPRRGELTRNALLDTAALLHNNLMVEKGSMSHKFRTEANFGDRMSAAGYRWSNVGENIAHGQNTALDVVIAWVCSETHRVTMFSCALQDIGVAANSTYYTQDFACRAGVTLCNSCL